MLLSMSCDELNFVLLKNLNMLKSVSFDLDLLHFIMRLMTFSIHSLLFLLDRDPQKSIFNALECEKYCMVGLW